MKLFLDKAGELNTVTSYGADHVRVRQDRFEANLIVLPDRIEADWASEGFEQLTESDFSRLAELGAEIVIIGTGLRQRFPDPRLLRPLMAARIGFEIMDLGSACRTFNILVAEGRNVAAALLIDPS